MILRPIILGIILALVYADKMIVKTFAIITSEMHFWQSQNSKFFPSQGLTNNSVHSVRNC